jgi:hypothetical protein
MTEEEKDKNKGGKEKKSKKRNLSIIVNTTDLAECMTSIQKGSKPE